MELNRAVQMTAHRGIGLPLRIAQAHQENGSRAELDNLGRVRLQVADFAGRRLVDGGFRGLRWLQESKSRIDEGQNRRAESASQHPLNKRSASLLHKSLRSTQ